MRVEVVGEFIVLCADNEADMAMLQRFEDGVRLAWMMCVEGKVGAVTIGPRKLPGEYEFLGP